MSEEISRGLAAERILADETMSAVWDSVKREMMKEWIETPEDKADRREALYRNVVAVDRVLRMLRTFVQNGKVAAEKARRATV